MAKQRTLSDGSKVVLTDMKITRRLDALTKLAANRVLDGCIVSTSAIDNMVNMSAGVVVMNNQTKYVPAATFSIGTMLYDRFSTIYVASTGQATVVGAVKTAPTHTNAWCPDFNAQPLGTYAIPKESILLAHISRDGASSALLVASYINNNVKPVLFFDANAWQKDNFTDIDTSIGSLER